MSSHTVCSSPRWRRRTGAAVGALLALVLSGCTGDEQPLPVVTAATPSVPVLQPGVPGQPNATLSGSAAAPVTTPSAAPADARFYQQMIVHHAQALVMVRSAAPDLSDAQVKALALRIGDEQEPEMGAMSAWLQGRGQDVPPEATNPNLTDHATHSMPGMATQAELGRLAAATGPDADRLFLTLMIRHHQGAIAMVEDHLRGAVDERVAETADDISVTQAKQVRQMREMLDRLG
ncbi:MAG: DUF305 domain-containing protein [Ornithinibacter sp.]